MNAKNGQRDSLLNKVKNAVTVTELLETQFLPFQKSIVAGGVLKKLSFLEDSFKDLGEGIDDMQGLLVAMENEIASQRKRIEELEIRGTKLSAELVAQKKALSEAEIEIASLKARIAELEKGS